MSNSNLKPSKPVYVTSLSDQQVKSIPRGINLMPIKNYFIYRMNYRLFASSLTGKKLSFVLSLILNRMGLEFRYDPTDQSISLHIKEDITPEQRETLGDVAVATETARVKGMSKKNPKTETVRVKGEQAPSESQEVVSSSKKAI